MKIIRKTESKSIEGFIGVIRGNRVFSDPSIQRRKVWGNSNREGYKKSLIEGTDTNNIVLCDIKSSMDNSFSIYNHKDYDYFSNLWNKGYRYISLDGGNRTEYLMDIYKDIDWGKPMSDELRDFLDTEINLVHIYNGTKTQLHQIAINLNSGESWNKQEKRNAMVGVVSGFIRDLGIGYSNELKLISGLSFPRMKDLELLSQFLLYHQYKTTPIKDKGLNSMYKNSEIHNEKQFLDIMKVWGKCLSLIGTTGSKISKTTSFNLFMFLLEMNRDYNCVLNKELISGFVGKYLELENKRIEDTLYDPLESNWKYLSRNMDKNLMYKFETIHSNFLPFVDDYFYQLDSVRVFSEMDKLIKYIETGGVIRRLDGSTELVTPLQVLNGNLIEGDHIKPHSKGGNKSLDNLELLRKSDNRKKSNKL